MNSSSARHSDDIGLAEIWTLARRKLGLCRKAFTWCQLNWDSYYLDLTVTLQGGCSRTLSISHKSKEDIGSQQSLVSAIKKWLEHASKLSTKYVTSGGSNIWHPTTLQLKNVEGRFIIAFESASKMQQWYKSFLLKSLNTLTDQDNPMFWQSARTLLLYIFLCNQVSPINYSRRV